MQMTYFDECEVLGECEIGCDETREHEGGV